MWILTWNDTQFCYISISDFCLFQPAKKHLSENFPPKKKKSLPLFPGIPPLPRVHVPTFLYATASAYQRWICSASSQLRINASIAPWSTWRKQRSEIPRGWRRENFVVDCRWIFIREIVYMGSIIRRPESACSSNNLMQNPNIVPKSKSKILNPKS